MREQDEPRAAICKFMYGGDARLYPCNVLEPAAFPVHRLIDVDAHKHCLAAHIKVV